MHTLELVHLNPIALKVLFVFSTCELAVANWGNVSVEDYKFPLVNNNHLVRLSDIAKAVGEDENVVQEQIEFLRMSELKVTYEQAPMFVRRVTDTLYELMGKNKKKRLQARSAAFFTALTYGIKITTEKDILYEVHTATPESTIVAMAECIDNGSIDKKRLTNELWNEFIKAGFIPALQMISYSNFTDDIL